MFLLQFVAAFYKKLLKKSVDKRYKNLSKSILKRPFLVVNDKPKNCNSIMVSIV